MTTFALMLVIVAIVVWRSRRRTSASGKFITRSRKFAALAATIAIVGIQAVITAPPAFAASCGEAPNPERPGSGLVGAIDSPNQRGLNSAYLDYSYAGMVWHTYETDCGPLAGITDSTSTIDTWTGNQLFNVAKTIVATTNSLHYALFDKNLLGPIYDTVKRGAEVVYNNVYAQLFGLIALLLAIAMFRNIWRGDLATVSKRALYMLAAVWLAASSFAVLRFLDPIDSAIVDTTTNIQAGFIANPTNEVMHEVLPTQLHTQVVYENWLRGEFGAPDSAEAGKYGKELLDAQAFSWIQMSKDEDANQVAVDAKKQHYKTIAGDLGPATGYFTGEDGSRTGVGFLALAQSLIYSLFQLLAKVGVLLAQVMVRLFILTGPLIGLVALLHHDILRKTAKIVGVVAFNLVILSVFAGIHALLLQALFGASTMDLITKMSLAAIVTILLMMVARPVRRLWQMVDVSVTSIGGALPAPRGGLFSKFFRKNSEATETPQDRFWKQMGESEGGIEPHARGPLGATAGGGRYRPEATVFANAQRLDRNGGAATRPGGLSPAGGGATAIGRAMPTVIQPAIGAADRDPFVLEGTAGNGRRMGGVPLSAAGSRGGGLPAADDHWAGERESMVVASRLTGPQPETAYVSLPTRSAPTSRDLRPEPRRVEPEMVAGKPVFTLYRPSRGIEVRDDLRDTDHVVR